MVQRKGVETTAPAAAVRWAVAKGHSVGRLLHLVRGQTHPTRYKMKEDQVAKTWRLISRERGRSLVKVENGM